MGNPIIVIGGGIAGICCIQQLAEDLPTTEILLITSSNLVKVINNIERFGLNLVRFNVDTQNLDQFKTNYPNVKVLIDKVINLDSKTKQIKLLKSDLVLNYDKLAICIGASPKSLLLLDNIKTNLSRKELDEFCCVIRDTETVKELEKKFSKCKRVAILGNGGIATELVFSIKFCKLIWIIKDQHITSTFLDAGASHFLRSFIGKDKDELKGDNLDSKMVKRLKYTIVEGDNKIKDLNTNELINLDYGSALGPDWQMKFDLKGLVSKDIFI